MKWLRSKKRLNSSDSTTGGRRACTPGFDTQRCPDTCLGLFWHMCRSLLTLEAARTECAAARSRAVELEILLQHLHQQAAQQREMLAQSQQDLERRSLYEEEDTCHMRRIHSRSWKTLAPPVADWSRQATRQERDQVRVFVWTKLVYILTKLLSSNSPRAWCRQRRRMPVRRFIKPRETRERCFTLLFELNYCTY
jgi:hypothetical protein